jgi:site-specific DNA recombinase
LEWVRTGKVKGLAFLDTDRFARDVHGALGYLKEVRKANGRILFGELGEYRDDEEFQMMLNMKLSFGQYQKSKIKALSRMATLPKIRSGEVHCGGHAPFGYTYESKTMNSPARLLIIPEQARIVVRIYTWYAQEGLSVAAIARRLIAEGVPAPKSHWNTMTIKKVLTNETYLGTWYYNKTEGAEPQQIRSTGPRHRRRSSKRRRPRSEWEGVAVERIITQDLADAAAARMESNRHTLGGQPAATYRAKGVIRCSLCNSYFVGVRNHGRPRYECSNRRDRVTRERKCMSPSLPAFATESAILAAIRTILADEGQLAALVAKHRSELAAGANTPDVEHTKNRIDQVRRREQKARNEQLKAAETGDADAEAFYDAEVREAHAQRLELQRQLPPWYSISRWT